MYVVSRRWGANTAITNHSVQTLWVSPHPLCFLQGSQGMYRHFGLWILDSPSNGWVQTLWCTDVVQSQQWFWFHSWPLLQSHRAHQEAFLSDRAWMPALVKYLSPKYFEHATKLQLFRAWSLFPGHQCNFTTGCTWFQSWTLWLLKAECLSILEKDLNWHLEVLIWDHLHLLVIFPYCMLWALR